LPQGGIETLEDFKGLAMRYTRIIITYDVIKRDFNVLHIKRGNLHIFLKAQIEILFNLFVN